MIESVDPETGDTGHLKREVRFEELLVILALLVVHDVVDEFVYLLVLHGRQVDAANITVYAYHWRQARGQVQVRRALFGTERQQFRYIHMLFPSPCSIHPLVIPGF